MISTDLLWQEHAPALRPMLSQWHTEKTLPPVLLLSGPSGIGIEEVSQYLAHCFLCLAWQGENQDQDSAADLFGNTATPPPTASDQACDQCSNCLQFLAGQSVDLQVIRAGDADSRSHSIKIDAFREVIAKQGFGAHQGRYKVIIIENAESMTTQAANSLLKILEEPPRGWIFILTVNHLSLLIPTLLSRCHRIRLRPLSTESVEKLLQHCEPERSARQKQIAARVSIGSLTRAQHLLREEQWDKRSALFQFIQKPQAEYSDWVEWAAADAENLELLVDQLELIIYDLLQWTLHSATAPGEYDWMNADGAGTLSQHAKNTVKSHGSIEGARQRWLAYSQRCHEVRSKMHAPLAKKLLVQDLLAPWFL